MTRVNLGPYGLQMPSTSNSGQGKEACSLLWTAIPTPTRFKYHLQLGLKFCSGKGFTADTSSRPTIQKLYAAANAVFSRTKYVSAVVKLGVIDAHVLLNMGMIEEGRGGIGIGMGSGVRGQKRRKGREGEGRKRRDRREDQTPPEQKFGFVRLYRYSRNRGGNNRSIYIIKFISPQLIELTAISYNLLEIAKKMNEWA